MKLKWKLLWVVVALYLFGVVGGGLHAYGATDPTKASPLLETIKIVFIMLGGLGVILPTYLNVWQSMETAELIQDQIKRNKVENTYKMIEKWDDTALLEARKFTRDLKEKHKTLSPDQLKEKINSDADLKRSVILVFNFFEGMRVSINNDRVDAKQLGETLGGVFHDIYDRFKPWIRDQEKEYQQDLEALSKLLPGHKIG